jgi:hypothetical protein
MSVIVDSSRCRAHGHTTPSSKRRVPPRQSSALVKREASARASGGSSWRSLAALASWTMPMAAAMIVAERRARPQKTSAAVDKTLCDRHGDADASINHPRRTDFHRALDRPA